MNSKNLKSINRWKDNKADNPFMIDSDSDTDAGKPKNQTNTETIKNPKTMI